jgi:hypothetical protein
LVDVERPQVWRELAWWIGHGAVAGVLAGVLFIMFEMLVAAFQTAGEGFFLPLRASATLFAGPDAMQPDYPFLEAIGLGFAAHVLLSAIAGMLLGALTAVGLSGWGLGLIGVGGLFGLVLWTMAGAGLGPVGWTRYLQLSEPLVQVFAYVVFFGIALGSYLAYIRPRRAAQPEWMMRSHSRYGRSGARRVA